MAVVHITDSNFGQVLQSDKPVLVDFWATWCGPCKMMAPILDELSGETEGKLMVAKLDVDENPRTAGQFGIMSIPTMIVFQKGRPIKQLVGYMPKNQLVSQLQGII